jgi:hypothetical protein
VSVKNVLAQIVLFRAGHVALRTLVFVNVLPRVLFKKIIGGKFLIAVRTLKAKVA